MRGLTRKQIRTWCDTLEPVEVLALVYVYAGVGKRDLEAVVPAGVLERLRERGLITNVRGRWVIQAPPRQADTEGDRRVSRLLRVWSDLYQAAHSVPPPQSQYGPAGAVIKRILRELERLGYADDAAESVLRSGLERYFATTNRFIIENLHAMGLFHRYWQRYCGLARTPKTTTKAPSSAPAPTPAEEIAVL